MCKYKVGQKFVVEKNDKAFILEITHDSLNDNRPYRMDNGAFVSEKTLNKLRLVEPPINEISLPRGLNWFLKHLFGKKDKNA